jgi:hypothetical protein
MPATWRELFCRDFDGNFTLQVTECLGPNSENAAIETNCLSSPVSLYPQEHRIIELLAES